MKTESSKKKSFFEIFASRVTQITGSTAAFLIAFGIVGAWAVCGPIFGYSETWQLVINTGTTIITFLMVFLIQKSQNKDSLALQLKLNELLASSKLASNRLVDIEDLTEEEMLVISRYYSKLNELAKKEKALHESHSLDEAKEGHEYKIRLKGKAKKGKPSTKKRTRNPKNI
ncbi:low affinity Fe/Cu permease [Flavobacterium gossypii]|uniref:Low affinity Fe/Cu permease n=1 Tax=Flavobacterium gossypii TaxID=1646119 RepID=A0ABR6DS12_9FLAO|nr:low affinity iron permease family protein [Flavobacterium gossypii]MBA9074234.1 low affinity Fe/Cu permease [Flavobacterium gossypii]